MSLRKHWRLVSDIATVARTLTKANGVATGYYHGFKPGEIARDVSRLHGTDVPARVAEIRQEAPDVVSLRLVGRHGPLPPFQPGQYVNLHVEIDGVRTNRPLSISSAPGQQGIEVTVKRKPGGFVSPYLIDEIRPGAELSLSGPSGDFHFNPLRDSEDVVFIAAGSGIAPFAGMLEHLLATRPSARALLIYGSRSEDQIIFHDRLDRLHWQHPERFAVIHTLTQPSSQWLGSSGRIDAELLRRELGELPLSGKSFFLCGPTGMIETAVTELEAMGVRRSRIQVESFGGAVDVTRAPDWPAGIDGEASVSLQIGVDGEKLPAQPKESLMVALERAGREVPSACRTGTCASCRCRLISGDVYTSSAAVLRDSDREAGFVHTCVTHPLGDVVLDFPAATKP